jgi:hypothetical protein
MAATPNMEGLHRTPRVGAHLSAIEAVKPDHLFDLIMWDRTDREGFYEAGR